MNIFKRRLVPLFLANLALGCMFHYAIVLPYMDSLGFSTTQLVMYAVITNLVVLLVEVPSGILADRWSRKGVLLASIVFMAVGCSLLGLADNYHNFMIATAFTGMYFGMSSGVQEAMLYDVLYEKNERKNYEKVLGRLRTTHAIGLIVSSLLGAALVTMSTFRVPFYVSVASCVIGFVAVAFFREPRLHREVESAHLVTHVTDLLRALTKHPETRLLVLTNVLIGIIFCFMVEIDQLWPVALGLATIWYGPLNALLLSSQGLAGVVAAVANLKWWLIRLLSFGVLFASLGLMIENIYFVVLSQFILLTCATTLMIILSGRVQDTLPSSQRSGSESAMSTLSRLSFIALLPLFSAIAQTQSVFVAAWVLVAVALCATIGLSRSFAFRR